MYIVDFFKKLARGANIPIIIYLLINLLIIIAFCLLLCQGVVWQAILLGILIYAISITIALSPIGEWILRFQTGCKKLDEDDTEVAQVLMPLFQEVYEKALKEDPNLPKDITLYINDDEDPNAFATGRKTICVTRGLLTLPADLIKATLGHEFGHLSHKDTDLILVVTVGNMIINAVLVLINISLKLGHALMSFIAAFIGGDEGWFMHLINNLSIWLSSLLITGLTWLWTKLGVLLVMKSSRSNEYEADEFSCKLGYAEELRLLLDAICGKSHSSKDLFANLASSHPRKEDRIARIQQFELAQGATQIETV